MENRLRQIVKNILPPILLKIVKPTSRYGWTGNYHSWTEAITQCSGYHADNILEKVKSAMIQVKGGKAVYERDSVLFSKIEYSWPLLSCLLWVAAMNRGSLRVIDFGGALGSSFYQNRKFLAEIEKIQWNVVEQSNFVECGRQYFQDEQLQFFESIDEAITIRGLPDLFLISCSLPYLEEPHTFIERLLSYRIPYLVIDNTPFNYRTGDRLTIQRVDPAIYTASYPCWLLDYESIKSLLAKKYTIHTEYKTELSIQLGGRTLQYQGLLAVSKTLNGDN